MVGQQRRTEGAASVTGGRLYPDPVEATARCESPVGHAVQRHAPGHDEVARAALATRRQRDALDQIVGDGLDRRGQVDLAPGDARLGLARRTAEEGGEARGRHRRTVEVTEVLEVEAVRAVGAHLDEVVADQPGVARLAVRCQAHQLVLAGVGLEPAEGRDRAVEQAERVRVGDLAGQLDVSAPTPADRGRRPLAHAVDGDDRGLVEGRRVERGGGVGQVVLAVQQPARPAEATEHGHGLVLHPQLPSEHFASGLDEEVLGAALDGVRQHAFPGQDRAVVVDDGVELVDFDERLLQAVVGRERRERRVVLDAAEPFLLGGGDHLVVAGQRGGRVVVVGRQPERADHRGAAGKGAGSRRSTVGVLRWGVAGAHSRASSGARAAPTMACQRAVGWPSSAK